MKQTSSQELKSKYYHITVDLDIAPHCWCYIIVGGRGRGKTYSTLKAAYEQKIPFIFIKRTMDDVDLLCSGTGSIGSGARDYGVNLSPFQAINRDTGSQVNAYSIKKGIAGFWDTQINEDGKLEPVGAPVGMIFALNGVTKYKGFELASSTKDQWIIFDEFIPNVYDRVNRKEGLQLLDFYKTVSRDRVQRGLNEVKLICLANATDISNPVFQTLEITDLVAEMQSMNLHFREDRGIYIHILEDNEAFLADDQETGLYKAMSDTAWGEMTYSNKFAYNDFSAVRKSALKNYICLTAYKYKKKITYIYYNDGMYYLTSARNVNLDHIYDLDRENEQKAFYLDWAHDLRMATIEDRVYFQRYTYYDLIVNYKKEFKL